MLDTTTTFGGELPDWLARRAETHPAHPALLVGEVAWTFAELDARVAAAAATLAALEVGAGQRVALLARNGAAFVVAVHALGRLGAVLVPLNTRLATGELAWQLGDCGVTLLLHDAEHADAAAAAAAGSPGCRLHELGSPDSAGAGAAVPLRERIALDAVQSIVYTSGTTGRPKGALLTWGNHWWSAIGSALKARWTICNRPNRPSARRSIVRRWPPRRRNSKRPVGSGRRRLPAPPRSAPMSRRKGPSG